MWRRTYLLLLLVRIYFALSPSYLHPDENFQGPEIIAGQIFPYPSHRTWEWTSSNPVRSVFPLWPTYGLPMTLLTWIWAADSKGMVAPEAIYYALRMVMFILSFVLEDWAIFELVHSPKQRIEAVALVASSYVTWTFQTHTFSNSLETLLVAWSLVLIDRITHEKQRSSIGSCISLSFLVVFGVFNRITFPAFIVIPGMRLLPHFLHRPFTLITITLFGALFSLLAIATDTAFYTGPASTASFRALFTHLYSTPVITPLNNLRYNTQNSNLALHGLHPHYQHLLINLPQLLGPALVPLLLSLQPFTARKLNAILANPRLTSALSGTLILSLIPHQEPRFLIPCIPLLLTCIRLPMSDRWRRNFWISWIVFNAFMAVLMGTYHQGGVIPAQIAMPQTVKTANTSDVTVFWWKTYPAPTYLIGNPFLDGESNKPLNITTVPLMGLSQQGLIETLFASISASDCADKPPSPPSSPSTTAAIFLAAPLSAHLFDSDSNSHTNHAAVRAGGHLLLHSNDSHPSSGATLRLDTAYIYAKHVNLDDLDFAEDGVFGTLGRVFGRAGLGVWRVRRDCDSSSTVV